MEQIQAIPQTDTPPTTPTEQTLNRLSRCISMILHPLTIPMWAGIILLFGNTFDGINAHKYQVVFLSCPGSQHVGIPAFCIGMLRMFHLIPDLRLIEPRQRLIPMLIVLLGYISCLMMRMS